MRPSGVRFSYAVTPMIGLEVEALFQSPQDVTASTQIEPMIGAGSLVFCKTLMSDFLATPALAGSEYRLMALTRTRLAAAAVGHDVGHPGAETQAARIPELAEAGEPHPVEDPVGLHELDVAVVDAGAHAVGGTINPDGPAATRGLQIDVTADAPLSAAKDTMVPLQHFGELGAVLLGLARVGFRTIAHVRLTGLESTSRSGPMLRGSVDEHLQRAALASRCIAGGPETAFGWIELSQPRDPLQAPPVMGAVFTNPASCTPGISRMRCIVRSRKATRPACGATSKSISSWPLSACQRPSRKCQTPV